MWKRKRYWIWKWVKLFDSMKTCRTVDKNRSLTLLPPGFATAVYPSAAQPVWWITTSIKVDCRNFCLPICPLLLLSFLIASVVCPHYTHLESVTSSRVLSFDWILCLPFKSPSYCHSLTIVEPQFFYFPFTSDCKWRCSVMASHISRVGFFWL